MEQITNLQVVVYTLQPIFNKLHNISLEAYLWWYKVDNMNQVKVLSIDFIFFKMFVMPLNHNLNPRMPEGFYLNMYDIETILHLYLVG